MNRKLRLIPVKSVKEVLDTTLVGITGGVTTNLTLAQTLQDYAGSQFTHPVGAALRSIYLFVQIITIAANANVDWYIYKRRGEQQAADFPIPGVTGASVVRNQIFHEEKGIPGDNADVNPLTFRGVIKIPRSFQRCRRGDEINIRFRGSADYQLCVKAVYKWFE